MEKTETKAKKMFFRKLKILKIKIVKSKKSLLIKNHTTSLFNIPAGRVSENLKMSFINSFCAKSKKGRIITKLVIVKTTVKRIICL